MNVRLPGASPLVLTAALALASTALAQTPPDPRLSELTYAPGAVYRIAGAFRTATQIVFSPEETIRHAAIGDSVAWEVVAAGSVLFLKPREAHPPTNLLVVTERSGQTRHYAFELSAGQRGAQGGVLYQVRFRYPQDEAAAQARRLAAETAGLERRLVGLELQQAALAGPRNLAWSAQGEPALQPSEVTDNGRFTVLRFPAGDALPALFEVGEDGAERLVPYDVRGEFVVIHGAPRALRLRRGRAVLCLFNERHDPRGGAVLTGTASDAVQRLPLEPGS